MSSASNSFRLRIVPSVMFRPLNVVANVRVLVAWIVPCIDAKTINPVRRQRFFDGFLGCEVSSTCSKPSVARMASFRLERV